MGVITGNDEEVIREVQRLVRSAVPDAVCEWKDYKHRIGCGALDAWGNIQDVKMLRGGLTASDVLHAAEVLAEKVGRKNDTR